MTKYIVMSKLTLEGDVTVDQIETKRTSRKAAEEDVTMFADVSHKKTWIVEEE